MTGTVAMRTPSVLLTEELVGTLVDRGGYTHPLFHPDDPARRPLPGQAVLLLMGGLVEQSGVLDHAIAMLEIRRARFTATALPGASLHVEVEPGEATPTRSGKASQVVTWTAYDDEDTTIAEAEVLMLVRPSEQGDA